MLRQTLAVLTCLIVAISAAPLQGGVVATSYSSHSLKLVSVTAGSAAASSSDYLIDVVPAEIAPGIFLTDEYVDGEGSAMTTFELDGVAVTPAEASDFDVDKVLSASAEAIAMRTSEGTSFVEALVQANILLENLSTTSLVFELEYSYEVLAKVEDADLAAGTTGDAFLASAVLEDASLTYSAGAVSSAFSDDGDVIGPVLDLVPLGAVLPTTPSDPFKFFVAVAPGEKADFVFDLTAQAGAFSPVPEPSSLAIWGVLALAVRPVRRRRR